MTNSRFNQLFVAARAAKQALDAKGFIQRNRLPKVTLAEHDELIKKHPGMAGFTRLFNYEPNDYVEDVNRMAPSRLPKITEVWVGARSLGCLDIEGQEDDARYQSGLMASQLDQEDAAELTDLATFLYHDPKTGVPLIEDPDTGELRPIVSGDCITVVRGSNDDLDAVYLEEGDDPRQQNDTGAEGGDHKWSGRFRANTDLEQSFLSNSAFNNPKGTRTADDFINEDAKFDSHLNIHNPSQARRHVMPNVAVEDLRWQPNDFEIRRIAARLVDKIITRRPDWADSALALTDEAEAKLRAMASDLKFDHEGNLIKGYFMSKDEFFGTMESNLKEFKATATHGYDYPVAQKVIDGKKVDTQVRRSKARPAPMDFESIGKAHAKVLRSNVHKPHLVKPHVTLTYSEAEHRALYEGTAESVGSRPYGTLVHNK